MIAAVSHVPGGIIRGRLAGAGFGRTFGSATGSGAVGFVNLADHSPTNCPALDWIVPSLPSESGSSFASKVSQGRSMTSLRPSSFVGLTVVFM
tara:strand:- start:1510 stop:1788 length:279 start_codon:yes stop_codon:yes gene_type:complete